MIRQTVPSDIVDLAPRLSVADQQEIEAFTGLGPLEVLSIGFFEGSSCMTGLVDGEIVAMMGVVPLVPHKVASVWLLSSDGIKNARREIVTEGRKWLDEQNALYPVLTNVVTESNEVHIRLIKHLGFGLSKPFYFPGTDTVALQLERRR